MSKKENKNVQAEQLSLFDNFFNSLTLNEGEVSFDELNRVIGELNKIKKRKKEKEEHLRKQKEREETQRKAEEERQRKEKHIQEITSMDLPMDWENVFCSDSRTEGVFVESISDGLIKSLCNLGKVDIEYISAITGKDYKTVICALKGSIYQNPEAWNECFYKGWETAEEYLSGNMMRKWKTANEANIKYNGYFADNLKAIKAVLPPTVAIKDIYITLGSPWVPTDIIDDFIEFIYKHKPVFLAANREYLSVKHDEITGTWEIPYKTRYNHSVVDTKTYGTAKLETLHILERTLNMKSVKVTDEVSCPSNASGVRRVINKEETVLAIEKQQKLIKAFQDWVWTDSRRKERLEAIYENNFSCVRRRIFDGSFLEFPDMSPDIKLYPYQKNAVARILFTPNTLLAHDVGAGKTYIMIAAGMEKRRIKPETQNLYVVPNNIVGQWENIFKSMYPDANILCVSPKSFTPQKREEVLENIRDMDYDGIIMAYSCFEQIPISKDYYVEELEESKKELERVAEDYSKATSRLERKRDAVRKALSELSLAMDDLYDRVYFDELGITDLYVDEAHNFKNIKIETKINNVLGISSNGSKKCKDMMDKVHLIQKQNNGGGVVMATGTPITNSITDAFVMQKYLQEGELALLDLQNFDSWVGMFAEKVSEFEIDVDTSSYRLTSRFAKFHNLPELTSILASIADFHQMDDSSVIPDFDGYTDAVVDKTSELDRYLKDISSRADLVRSRVVDKKEDNLLKITTDGRKAALDIRLVEPNAGFTYQSKVARCAENVFNIYMKTFSDKSTQLIFCDTSTPKNTFNVYDEMKRLLLLMGVKENEIAFVHDATTENERNKLFNKMRTGEIRVLIGSTFKLGLGVNVQNKLIAVHHLDVPWRPADMTQREGRILRQGNENTEVYIYRYITEGSFDAYSWQLLETKQRFISGLLSGSLTERSGTEIDNTVLDYAEVKALAVGDPLIKERVETANELSRYMALQKKTIESHILLEKELMEIPSKIKYQNDLIEKCKADMEFYESNKRDYTKQERKVLRELIFEALSNNVLMQKETPLTVYQGFQIILPSNMTDKKPFLWLQKNGKYYVSMGDTEIGTLVRIDNFLDDLDKHLERLLKTITDLEQKAVDAKAELAKKDDYSDKIEETKQRLEAIDNKLGVKKK